MKAFTKHIKKHSLFYGLAGVAIDFFAIGNIDKIINATFDAISKMILNRVGDVAQADKMAVLPCVIIGALYAVILLILALPAVYHLTWLFNGSGKVIERAFEAFIIMAKRYCEAFSCFIVNVVEVAWQLFKDILTALFWTIWQKIKYAAKSICDKKI